MKRRARRGRAHAEDDPLTVAMRKRLDVSFVVFSGETAKVGSPPADWRTRLLRRLTCEDNLSRLGTLYLDRAQENRAKTQTHSGSALWLSMRKGGEEVRRGEERVLLCPCDASVRPPRSKLDLTAWDDVDLARPKPGLCSYAGRDFVQFPIAPTSGDEPIGACLRHAGGAVVVFDFGLVTFLSLEELGLSSDSEKTVGRDSKSPLLRKLR